MTKATVLFLCTHNSSRSQIAEGLLRDLDSKLPISLFESMSAGTQVTIVRPQAIQVMQEIGIDISSQYSKSVDEFTSRKMDLVITVCDVAAGKCPLFQKAKAKMHWNLPDPTKVDGTEEEILQAFRDVRDQLIKLIKDHLLDK